MQAAVAFALRARLREYESIKTEVDCDAMGVLDGHFRSMAIVGEGWRTPLGMTARRLEVDISGLHVDYGALVFQRKVALKGSPPKGHTTITLSARDLGAFTQHPIFLRAAATAVRGQAFAFDPDTVSITHRPAGGGQVLFEGMWAANGERYKILMQPGSHHHHHQGHPGAPGSGPSSCGIGHGGAAAAAASAQKKKLRVGAMHVPRDGAPPDSGSAAVVAAGIADFFAHMAIDLDGIEVSKPVLSLRPWAPSGGSGRAPGGGGGSGGAVSNGHGAAPSAPRIDEGDVLDICMRVRIRAFPPLNMQF